MYVRFPLCLCNFEDLLFEGGIDIRHETVRHWWNRFGPLFAADVRHRLGLYGNFGQSNYGAAKMAVVGLMNVLHIEGAKNNIRVNTLAPGAATQMTRDLLPAKVVELMEPEAVTPGLLYLVSEDAPFRVILDATAGGFARTETDGIYLTPHECMLENVAARFDEISDTAAAAVYEQGGQQVTKFISKAAAVLGIRLQ